MCLRLGSLIEPMPRDGDPRLGHSGGPGVGGKMRSPEELRRENQVLRDRISKLSSAILRISVSLDVATVLNEVVESACALTGARNGVIMSIDEAGRIQEFIILGITPEEYRQLMAWPDRLEFFEHLQQLPGPIRMGDVPGYVRSLGYRPPAKLSMTMLGTHLRHRGAPVGAFFLGGKEGGQGFTSEDEELLVLFAAQAAAAVVNARKHRDEQRVRADLEALIDTSPVGVAVFDAGTGKPVSLNREAKRIVDGLRTPGRASERLREILTLRRADGQEVSLQASSLAQALQDVTLVRAEEMVLRVPDGRSVKVLMNVTPIRAKNGTVESVVATVQDLEPIEELERMRAGSWAWSVTRCVPRWRPSRARPPRLCTTCRPRTWPRPINSFASSTSRPVTCTV